MQQKWATVKTATVATDLIPNERGLADFARLIVKLVVSNGRIAAGHLVQAALVGTIIISPASIRTLVGRRPPPPT
ncbi:MAG: hypothetical protein K1X53_05090 [Candidatus Sumerlaeaceae bacterium]|nr:hypothetical protein [Candidatus Sumerlaeaceae bacterium]